MMATGALYHHDRSRAMGEYDKEIFRDNEMVAETGRVQHESCENREERRVITALAEGVV